MNRPPLGFYSPNENTDRHSRQTQDSIWELPELSLHWALLIARRSLRQNGTNQNFKTRFWGGHSNGFGLLCSQSIYFSWTLQHISDKSRAHKKRRVLCFPKGIYSCLHEDVSSDSIRTACSGHPVCIPHVLSFHQLFHPKLCKYMTCQSLHPISCKHLHSIWGRLRRLFAKVPVTHSARKSPLKYSVR